MSSLDILVVRYMSQPCILAKEKIGGAGRDIWFHRSAKAPFDYLTDYSVNPGAAAGTYASLFRLLLVISITGFFVAGGFGLVRLMWISKNGSVRDEEKKAFEFKIALVCAICVLLGIVGWIGAFWKGVL